ncbi:hypothetical protein [Nocardia sp. NPDC057455]|uniref:hypothetical protein n=1 Tax=Nocardia sp. NPDC057455 TaxID=3346138 RepID=UPI00366E4B6B
MNVTEPTTCQLRGCDNPAAVPFLYEYPTHGEQQEIRWRCHQCEAQIRRNIETMARYPY